MPSIDFLLARLTAQTGPLEERIPSGSGTGLTNADIAQATGEVRSTIGYYALLANRCRDDRAMDQLLIALEPWAWRRWHQKKRPGRIDIRTHALIVEVSVLYFLNPVTGQKRGDRGCARFVKVARKTWALNFRAHYRDVSAYLFEEESQASKIVARKLR